MAAHGIMFHYFHDQGLHIPAQGSISATKMNDILNYYQAQGYHLLNAKDWREKALNHHLKDNQICITFDDGLKAQFEIAASVLKARKLTAFYFIPTYFLSEDCRHNLEVYRHFRSSQFDNIEQFYQAFFKGLLQNQAQFSQDLTQHLETFKTLDYLKEFPFYTDDDRRFRYIRDIALSEREYHWYMEMMMQVHHYQPEKYYSLLWMSASDIKALDRDENIIGLHSHHHPTNLQNYPYQYQYQDYSQNKNILEDIIGHKISSVSYPCNSYNQDTLQIMSQLGVDLGFRSNMQSGFSSLLEIGRQDNANIPG
ncbi:polysaccharide deacetylase [Clostridiales bacterium COT073_COT-073]|nr:polysaccharide deacetylase [Clostridiales bacterium COT073_COT-073]